jgi:hypothetical protein
MDDLMCSHLFWICTGGSIGEKTCMFYHTVSGVICPVSLQCKHYHENCHQKNSWNLTQSWV